jgi:hypothetical protein
MIINIPENAGKKRKKITIIIEDQPSRGDPIQVVIEKISWMLRELWKWLKPWPRGIT